MCKELAPVITRQKKIIICGRGVVSLFSMSRLENVNPTVVGKVGERSVLPREEDDSYRDEIDAREIFGE